VGSPRDPSQPDIGLERKNRRPPHRGLGEKNRHPPHKGRGRKNRRPPHKGRGRKNRRPPHSGREKNQRPSHNGAGEETADAETPPEQEPLGVEPTRRTSSGVTIRPLPCWFPPRRCHNPPLTNGGASRPYPGGTGVRRPVPQVGGTQWPQSHCAAAPRCGSTP